MNLLSHVNPLQGTDSTGNFSRGNTMPLVAVPYGMAHWSLQTDNGSWAFNPTHPKLQGVRCTHQPSPWMGDYGAFVIMPQAGPRYLSPGKRASSWRIDKAKIHPHKMFAELVATGVELETTPTERGAVFRFRFPEEAECRLILQGVRGETHFEVRPDGRTIVGFTRGNSGGVPANFANYFVAVVDRAIESWATFQENDLGPQGEPATAEALGLCAELGKSKGEPVLVRVATSFISIEQAERNLRDEIGDAGFDEIAARAEAIWEKELGQIEIETDDETARRTFYSCFYRTKLFPRIWHEKDEAGNLVHFSPYDGQIHPGVMYADTGFWDTYRTQFPLLTLLEPDRVAEIMQGFVNATHESGWMPQWPSPGHRVCMPGTHLDVTVADAAAKGIRGFDLEAALQGMIRHADHSAADGPNGAGRHGIEEYLEHGYRVTGASVAETLDYAYDDWGIAQVAAILGDGEVETRMLERAKNYRHLYDPAVGFMRSRHADGSWQEPFDPIAWGGAYCEGGPWQSSWAVQHDPAGLMALMGGEDAFAAKLDEMLMTPPRFHVGGYSMEIHEMTEMALADFGQYAQSNQPVHHVLYLYLAAGRPWRTQKEVRRVMAEMYTPDAFPGDEDNGEMAAWYVLSALGIFPLCPGRPEWALGSPLFKRAKVHLPNGKTLLIDAPENAPDRPFVEGTSHQGHMLTGTTITHAALLEGGPLHFHMAAKSSERRVSVSGRPASMTPYESLNPLPSGEGRVRAEAESFERNRNQDSRSS